MREAIGGSVTIKNTVLAATGCCQICPAEAEKNHKLQLCGIELINPHGRGI
jgi:hypothetical protein